ncbi:uncharacterized protein LOC131672853 [Phymastichus coffea]|uniref:uncharacterized protein LOC131672853 n=1 Tax=Phymastichus coffea TaxID=108790 RepID=UPI00273BF1F7|nr:uncharacterized protein LOC131672853 [Phymastichus coffea]
MPDSPPLNLSSGATAEPGNMSERPNPPAPAGVELIRHVAIRTPPFLRGNPEAWFTQLESVFQCHNIRSDLQRYHAAVAGLDSETIQDSLDVLQNPPSTGAYDNLKEQIIRRYGDTATQRLHKFFSGLTMGDRTPSQLLRRMRTLAGGTINDDAIRVRWLDLMPTTLSRMLRIMRNTTLDDLALTADELAETSLDICAVQRLAPTPPVPTAPEAVRSTPDSITAELAALRATVSQLVITTGRILDRLPASGGRARSRTRARSTGARATGGAATSSANSSWCYYHRQYQANAERCRPPCSYPANQSTN